MRGEVEIDCLWREQLGVGRGVISACGEAGGDRGLNGQWSVLLGTDSKSKSRGHGFGRKGGDLIMDTYWSRA